MNSNGVSYTKLFNQAVDEFFQNLIERFPQETKIKVNYNMFQTLASTNVKKPCTEFMLGSIPYLPSLVQKDDTFFTSESQPELLKSMNFSKIWTPDLDQGTKDTIWAYIKNFFAIGIKVVDMPEETLPLINFIINN